MQVNVSTVTSYTLTDDKDQKFELTHQPVHTDDIIIEKTEDRIAIGYLVLDASPDFDYFDDGEANGELLEFNSIEPMQDKIDELKANDKRYFFVEKYEHGSVHYSIKNSVNYPDRTWDVVCNSIFVLPDYMITYSSDARFKYAKAMLDSYSSWCNGEVYGVCMDVFDVEGTKTTDDSCWNFIGYDHALESLKEEMEEWSK